MKMHIVSNLKKKTEKEKQTEKQTEKQINKGKKEHVHQQRRR